MAIVFGNVPHPDFVDRLIPDVFNRAWDNLGQRTIKGVVYHRMLGSTWGTDGYFRTTPPGGLDFCPAVTNFNWGGCNALTDYGVDAVTGQILRWNDPLGQAHTVTGEDGVTRAVSANRAAWASGPVAAPYGDGLAFLVDHGWDYNIVNRDQASIEISGGYNDPITDACKDSVAALSAYFADQFGITWDSYPLVPGKTYNFTRWHQEFTIGTGKICPGPVVMEATTDIINRTMAILRAHQTAAEPAYEFIAFDAPRRFRVPMGARATGREGPSRLANIVREFEPGEEIVCDGLFHGDPVEGEDRWLRMSDPPRLAIHISGLEEAP